MGETPGGARTIRLNAWDRAFALWDPEAPPPEPRWHLVAESLAALEEKAAVVLCGHAPRGVVIEVEQAEDDRPPQGGALRLGVSSPRGKVWLGDPASPTDGGWIESEPGTLAVEVRRLEAGRYSLRIAPANAPFPRLTVMPLLEPTSPQAYRHLVRPRALEALLAGAERAHDPAQDQLMRRLGRHDRLEIDLERGELSLELDGRQTQRVAVHPLGTEGDLGGFRWAWANESFDSAQTERAARMLAYGFERHLAWLTEEELEVPPADVRRLACLGAPLLGCAGFYPARYARGVLWLAVE